MAELHDALRAWGTEGFAPLLKRAIEGLAPGTLPLDRRLPTGAGRRPGNHRDGHRRDRCRDARRREGGVFFAEVIAGCSCGDEPFDQPGFCELEVRIDKATGTAVFTLPPA